MTAVGVRHDVTAKSLKLDRDFLRRLWVDSGRPALSKESRHKTQCHPQVAFFVGGFIADFVGQPGGS